MQLFYTVASAFLISFASLTGAVTLILNQHRLQSILLMLVSLSAGTLMGGAFLHLLPEAIGHLPAQSVFLTTLIAFVGFFFIERVLHWHHCHKERHERKILGAMNLTGDTVHNFLDGLILAAAFSVDVKIGFATAIAIALHEIPQEVSDFGVLLHSGWEKKRALLTNYLVSLTIVAGAVIGFLLAEQAEALSFWLMPVAAGGFIYIAAADLMPEIRQEKDLGKSLLHMTIFITGVFLMFLMAQGE
ncbi:MAG: ZIP family metal transporter [Candidatus Pacebacteria bacterium CG_4_10_14_0_8_um_filter_43_12]|nr:MAG: ZIP family metal transporter [Candidatus Pacebacteria bacterium CG_4_10_14_0_8_um_filter_43_12]